MAQLPLLKQEQFEEQRQDPNQDRDSKTLQQNREEETPSQNDVVQSDSDHGSDMDEKFAPSPSQCLFCDLDSLSLDTNVKHMYSAHGLFIPEPDQLSDMETFLAYLALIIFEYNQCLYCGMEKSSLEAVQAHMKDKGHCMINLDKKETELLDFWDALEVENETKDVDETNIYGDAVHISATEIRLPSGLIVNSRSNTTQLHVKPALRKSRNRIKRDAVNAITEGEKEREKGKQPNDRSGRTKPGSHLRVAVRGELGLVGLQEHEKRALMVTEKKMKKRETVARAAQRWATEKVANKQKYYKVCTRLLHAVAYTTNTSIVGRSWKGEWIRRITAISIVIYWDKDVDRLRRMYCRAKDGVVLASCYFSTSKITFWTSIFSNLSYHCIASESGTMVSVKKPSFS
jgi:pre-60S factor REI1